MNKGVGRVGYRDASGLNNIRIYQQRNLYSDQPNSSKTSTPIVETKGPFEYYFVRRNDFVVRAFLAFQRRTNGSFDSLALF